MHRALPVVLACLTIACVPAQDRPTGPAAPAEQLVWPEPPAKPRIKLLYEFHEPKDLGLRPPLFERVWEAVAGEELRGMVRPYAIAVRGSRLVVADAGLGVLHLFNLEAHSYERIVTVGDLSLRSPVGVALAPNRIYVADSELGKIFGLDGDGGLTVTVANIGRPTGLAYDEIGGRLYAADTLAHRIMVFDPDGNRLFAFGARGTEDGAFNYPTHLALRGGRLYVNDTMNFRLQVFDLEGNHVSTFGNHGDGSGNMAQSKGVGVDREGHVYVADALFDRVQIFEPDGRFLLAFGGAGQGPGQFWLPGGLFVDDDRIYVADTYNRRVQVFQFLGGD